MTADDLTAIGRDAFERRAWAASYEAFTAADAETGLQAADLDLLATAAHLTGRYQESATVWARAHEAHAAVGERELAARSAFWLGFGLANAADFAQASGWFARAGRLLEEMGTDCVERGYLILPMAIGTFEGGDAPAALGLFEQAAAYADRYDDRALRTMAVLGRARCLIRMERAREGVPLLDEVMVAVTAGDVPVIAAGDVYCTVILGCRDLFDYRRSREWTLALTRWCESQPDLVPYRGQCLVHRSEIFQLRGDWTSATEEAARAYDALSDPPGQWAMGNVLYQQAELHRLRGAFAEAEDLYRGASEYGHEQNPGLALLRLAQGKVDNAIGAIKRATDEASDRVARARMLPAFVEIMLAAGRVDDARGAAKELEEIAASLESSLLRGLAANASGGVALAGGDARAALEAARTAWSIWQELEAPYEGARARIVAGLACRELGDEDGADLELHAARRTFESLGAAHDVTTVDRLAAAPVAATGGLTGRELEVLRLVAAGKTNRAIASELVLSEKTIARHLSNIFTKLGLASRAAATAYAYEHDLV